MWLAKAASVTASVVLAGAAIMGAQSSKDLKIACNYYVAQFVQERPVLLRELIAKIQTVAQVENCHFSGSNYFIVTIKKRAANQHSEEILKSIIQDFFSSFTTFVESFDSRFYHEINSYLSQQSRHNMTYIVLAKAVRLTGYKDALNNAVRHIHFLQESTDTKTVDALPNSSYRQSNKEETYNQLVELNAYEDESEQTACAEDNSYPISQSQLISSVVQRPPNEFISLPTLISNPLPPRYEQSLSEDNTTSSSDQEQLVVPSGVSGFYKYASFLEGEQLCKTNEYETPSDDDKSMSRCGVIAPDPDNIEEHALSSKFSSDDEHEDDIEEINQQQECSQDGVPQLNPDDFLGERIQDTNGCFMVVAKNTPIARCIMMSREHMVALRQIFVCSAHVTVKYHNIDSKSHLVYNFQRKGRNENSNVPKNKLLSEYCEEKLILFLSGFKKKLKTFEFCQWNEAFQKDSTYFNVKQQPGKNSRITTKWYDNRLLVAGLSEDVDKKVEEISSHLNKLFPLVYPYRFCKTVENQHVGHFMLESHKSKIKKEFKHLAKATLTKEDGNVVIQFSTTKSILEQSVPSFKEECENLFDEVLAQYSSSEHHFSEEIFTELEKHHEYIFKSTKDVLVMSHDPYLLSGTRQGVENRMQEVLKIISEIEERNKPVIKQMFTDLSKAKKQRTQFLYRCNQDESEILNFIANHDCCQQLLQNINRFGEVKFDHPDDSGIHRMLVTLYKVYQGIYPQVMAAIKSLFNKFAIKQIQVEIIYLRKIHINESGLFTRKKYNNPSAKVFANFDPTGKVFVVGFKADVQKRLKDINEARMRITSEQGSVKEVRQAVQQELQKEFEKAFSQEEANVLECCGIIDEIRTSCEDITIFMENGSLQLKGSPKMVDKAKSILDKKLLKSAPLISENKMEYFEVFSKNSSENAERALKTVNDKVLQLNLKGILMYESGKLVLMTSDETSHSDISKEIEGMLFERVVTIARNQLKLLTDNALLEIVSESLKWKVVAKIDKTRGYIFLIGLDELIVKNTEKKFISFFRDRQTTTVTCECPKQFLSFCIKQCSQVESFPDGVTKTQTKSGCTLHGSRAKVLEAQKIFQDIQSKVKMVEMAIKKLGFWAFMQSKAATSVLTSAEEKFGCQLKLIKDTTSDDLSSSSASPKTAQNNCSYGKFTVQVCRGDITTQNCDVLVNHCSQQFDLNWGSVSKAMLKKAGRAMQVALNARQKETCFCKVTKGWGLPCKKVVHVMSPTSLDGLTPLILDALRCSELNNARSVAIPTLGAGGIGFDKNTVASAFVEAMEEFNTQAISSVKSIRVVVYDATLLQTFLQHIIYTKNFIASGEMNLRMAESQLNKNITRGVKIAMLHCKYNFQLPQLENFLYNRAMESLSSEEFCHEALARFGNHEWVDIYRKATTENVQLTQSSCVDRKSKVLLLGMPEGVGRMKEFMKELVFEFQQSELSAAKLVWQWSATQENFRNFSPRISSAVEAASKKTAKQVEVKLEGSKSLIDFSQLTFTCNGFCGFVRRKIVSTALPLPREWSDMKGEGVRKIVLKETSAEYQRVKRLVFASKPSLLITEIERIQNPVLYRHYLTQKESIAGHVTSGNPVERELFHGTSSKDATKICNQGFDKGFIGKNATAFGNGNYFAVHSKYAMVFATADPSGQSERTILLAQVLTGDFCQGRSGLKAPPAKRSSSKSGHLYDSVVNDPAKPAIFVVFKDASSYPAYLIKFLPTA